MEWTIRLEARTGWGEVTTYESGMLRRGLHDLTVEGVGLAFAEAKTLLAELQRRIVLCQVEEYVTCARVCPNCMKQRPRELARANRERLRELRAQLERRRHARVQRTRFRRNPEQYLTDLEQLSDQLALPS